MTNSFYYENEVRLTGRLAKDPEIFNGEKPWGRLVLPTERRWINENGETVSHTEWHTVILNGREAIYARDFLQKGSVITVKGEIRYRKWEEKYFTEIHAHKILSFSSKKTSNDSLAYDGVPMPPVNSFSNEKEEAIKPASQPKPAKAKGSNHVIKEDYEDKINRDDYHDLDF